MSSNCWMLAVQCLIWIYTFCLDLSVQTVRVVWKFDQIKPFRNFKSPNHSILDLPLDKDLLFLYLYQISVDFACELKRNLTCLVTFSTPLMIVFLSIVWMCICINMQIILKKRKLLRILYCHNVLLGHKKKKKKNQSNDRFLEKFMKIWTL